LGRKGKKKGEIRKKARKKKPRDLSGVNTSVYQKCP